MSDTPLDTYKSVIEAVKANIDSIAPEIASLMVMLGAKREWSMDDNFATTESIAALASAIGLPSAGDRVAADLRFWGPIAQALGYSYDEWDEPDTDGPRYINP